MKFSETNLKGLYIIDIQPNVDDRGSFFRTFCVKEFAQVGLTKAIVQINQSVNTFKGTFRGFHFQESPFQEIKMVRCISGKVIDIVIDIRKNSKTFLQSIQVELSEGNNKMVYIPEGFAHGFFTLEDSSKLIYFHSAFYNPEYQRGLMYNDPLLKMKLPYKPIYMSDKDKKHPLLDNNFKGI